MYDLQYDYLSFAQSYRHLPFTHGRAGVHIDTYGLASKYGMSSLKMYAHMRIKRAWHEAKWLLDSVDEAIRLGDSENELTRYVAPIYALNLRDLQHPLTKHFLGHIEAALQRFPHHRPRFQALEQQVPLFRVYRWMRSNAAADPYDVVLDSGYISQFLPTMRPWFSAVDFSRKNFETRRRRRSRRNRNKDKRGSLVFFDRPESTIALPGKGNGQ